MFPVLFRIGTFEVTSFGVMVAVGALVGLYVFRRRFLLEFARTPPTPLERCEALEQVRAIEHGVRIAVV